MQKSRNAFTMIELIFVIVILGILAAVAIPKLAATRNDAKVSVEINSASQGLENLGAEFTAQGAFNNYTVVDANFATKCFLLSISQRMISLLFCISMATTLFSKRILSNG